jgi:hypothetical protein
VLYACDGAWWKIRKGVPEFSGLKITQDQQAIKAYPELRKIGVRGQTDRLVAHEPGIVACGSRKGYGHSGFQALNLAVQFGAARIILVGYDMQGEHWHGRHPSGLNNPGALHFSEWRRGLDAAAPTLTALGIEVLNASRESALTQYPVVDLEDAIAC